MQRWEAKIKGEKIFSDIKQFMRYTCLFDNFDKNIEYYKKGRKIVQNFFLASFDFFFYNFGPFYILHLFLILF